MNEQEMTIFNRIIGFGAYKVEIEKGVAQDEFKGLIVNVFVDHGEPMDFFFPDYAQMSDAEMAEVIANNLREELWRRVRP